MRSLSKCDSSIIYQCIDDIVFASDFYNCDYTDNSEGEKDDMAMYDLNIARGIKNSSYFAASCATICRVIPRMPGLSAKITAENHPQTKPDKDVLKVLMTFCTQRMLELLNTF